MPPLQALLAFIITFFLFFKSFVAYLCNLLMSVSASVLPYTQVSDLI